MKIPSWVFIVIAVLAVSWGWMHTMPSAHASAAESEIRQWLDQWQKAFHEKDLDAIMSLYASGNERVVFDLVLPLQYIGADAYRKDYKEFLAQYDGPDRKSVV